MSDTADEFSVPIIPNRPLKFAGEDEAFGPVALRRNSHNGFIENGAFDAGLIAYDADYQNNQALSAAFEAHMKNVVGVLQRRYPDGARIVEVGCGKGDFLEMLQADGSFQVSGYDGAYEGDNPAIEKRFLDASDNLDADLVILRHVLEHIRRPQDFLQLLARVFGNADIYIEVPDFAWIEKNQAFFDITYEHVNYFTPESLSGLFTSCEKSGLLFGDQYQFVIAALKKLNYADFNAAYDDSGSWSSLNFASAFPDFESVIANIDEASAGRSIYVWGAATKGVMFCHHVARLRPGLMQRVRAAVDINPMKAGRFMPSVQLPILDVDALCDEARGNELFVIMNPNYKNEILAELAGRGLTNVEHISV